MKTNNNIENILDSTELINLIKIYNFKSVDVSNMATVKYSKTENPFDVWNSCYIKLSPLVRDYNDSLLIDISKYEGKYIIRIGADTGWTGGLETSSTELSFEITNLTFENFKQGFLNASINQKYCLVSKYSTGNIDKIFLQGSLEEIKKYGIDNGYEIIQHEGIIFDFYLSNKNLPTWKTERNLQVYVLTSQQIYNINNYR